MRALSARDVILRNLAFDGAPRIGFHFTGERRNDLSRQGADLPPEYHERRWTEGHLEFHDDVWGNVWRRVSDMGSGGEICRPALAAWNRFDRYAWPDLARPALYADARTAFARDRDLYRIGCLPGFPFAICRNLRGMENYFQDLLLERERVDALHALVAGLLEDVMRQFASAGADAVMAWEDWGVQDRLLISPALWREVFKPLFMQLCGTAHGLGMSVFLHSCGHVWDILDDLAAAGVNAFQFDQPTIYGSLDRLAQKLRDLRVCLYAPVDIQRVLPGGERDVIVSNARRMCELFGGPNGGFIAKNYHDLKGIGVREEWDQWAYKAFVAAGDFGVPAHPAGENAHA